MTVGLAVVLIQVGLVIKGIWNSTVTDFSISKENKRVFVLYLNKIVFLFFLDKLICISFYSQQLKIPIEIYKIHLRYSISHSTKFHFYQQYLFQDHPHRKRQYLDMLTWIML